MTDNAGEAVAQDSGRTVGPPIIGSQPDGVNSDPARVLAPGHLSVPIGPSNSQIGTDIVLPETNTTAWTAGEAIDAATPALNPAPTPSSETYPFFDVDLKNHKIRYAIKTYDTTIPRENHGWTNEDYKGPSLFFPDPKTEVVSASDEMKTRKLNPAKTYRYFVERSIVRLANGEYAATSISTRIWSTLFFLITLTFIVLALWKLISNQHGGDVNHGVTVTFDQWVAYFIIVVCLPWLLVGTRTSEFVKGCLLTIDLWFLAVFILSVTYVAEGDSPSEIRNEPGYRDTFIVLTSLAIFAIVVLLLLELTIFKIMPFLLHRNYISDARTFWLWDIKPVEDRLWTWSYRAFLDSTHRSNFSYRGSINENGEPHGHGEWLDDGLRGESLVGLFENGVPVAPFTSAIPSTGSAFTAMRIGFGKNNKANWDQGNLHPERDPEGLKIGVAAVEVSIAGKFLKNLPVASLVMPPEPVSERSKAKVTELLAGFPCDPTIDECVLYIHGLWNTSETALAEISQFRALAAYSPAVKFFCFDWPAGLYPWATFKEVRKMSKSQGVKEDLRDFIKVLTSLGFRKFNVIGHSMGCRITCHITEYIEELFEPLPESHLARKREALGAAEKLPELSSVTLIHGELDLVDFITIKFPVLRQYTRLITSYTDSHDKALEFAEFLTDRLSMGKNPGAYFVDPYATSVNVGKSFDIAAQCRDEFTSLLKTAPDTITFKRRATTDLAGQLSATGGPGLHSSATLIANEAEQAITQGGGVAIPMQEIGADKSVGTSSSVAPVFSKNVKLRNAVQMKQPRIKAWLDMDVIDSSFLDSNASVVRHSIFVFNRSLLDDIHQGWYSG